MPSHRFAPVFKYHRPNQEATYVLPLVAWDNLSECTAPEAIRSTQRAVVAEAMMRLRTDDAETISADVILPVSCVRKRMDELASLGTLQASPKPIG